MIDERFSADAFARAGYGTKQARALSRDLQDEVQKYLDTVIQPAILDVIDRLNALGHRLSPAGELLPGDKQFSESCSGDDKRYKFLVAVDIVVSVGYPDTVDKDEGFDESST